MSVHLVRRFLQGHRLKASLSKIKEILALFQAFWSSPLLSICPWSNSRTVGKLGLLFLPLQMFTCPLSLQRHEMARPCQGPTCKWCPLTWQQCEEAPAQLLLINKGGQTFQSQGTVQHLTLLLARGKMHQVPSFLWEGKWLSKQRVGQLKPSCSMATPYGGTCRP